MLYDKRWNHELPHITRARQLLLKAAEYLDQHGWCRMAMRTSDGRVCIVGAIKDVSSPENIVNQDAYEAYRLVGNYVGHGVVDFNDVICQSKEQAIKAMVGAAIS